MFDSPKHDLEPNPEPLSLNDQITYAVIRDTRNQQALNTQKLPLLQEKPQRDEIKHSLCSGTYSLYLRGGSAETMKHT